MQLMSGHSLEKGDTLIEVMISFALFAAIAVTTLAVMNQGTGTVQRALEITQVRAQMDAQIEALQYVHEAYVAGFQRGVAPAAGSAAAQWVAIKANYAVTAASTFGQLNAGKCLTTLPANAFIMNAQTAVPQQTGLTSLPPAGGSLPPFSQVLYDGSTPGAITNAYGIWLEAVSSPVAIRGTPYIDFHVRACWDGAGSNVPATLGTIVRLYDPS
jgi:type II secretory pathway pseudopilin PulG